ncbi:MAG: glutamate--tRNA ligase [Blastocatellia bacterium]|nr:glutamate--tRNA ligase [Blastocatellia bacterium]
MSEIRVRFAPSPTGYLHVGGARTALFNWLFARKVGGKFILRIEDTDLERSTKAATETILQGLTWLGLDWDEGPYFQTENIELHRKRAYQLVESGSSYRCFCTKQELDAKRKEAEANKVAYKYDGTCRRLSKSEIDAKLAENRPFVIRFAVPQDGQAVTWNDLVYGEQVKQHSDIEDFVMIRADGSPLYILSNVVDDADQRVTHVVRGQDGLPNTPKQILIYKALGEPVPNFAHLPLILDNSRAKLSKRFHGDVVMVSFYQERGFIPDALLNFLALLGWSPGMDREIFSRQEMIELFSFEGVNRSNGVFNFRKGDERNWTDPKALWMNAEYVSKTDLTTLLPMVIEEFKSRGMWREEYEKEKAEWFAKTVDLLRARYRTLVDFPTLGRAYFEDDFTYEDAAVSKNLKDPLLKELLPALAERFAALEFFTLETTEEALRKLAEESGIKAGLIINGARTALTGQSVGPGMFDVIVTIGQKRCVERLKKAAQLIS